MAPQGRARSDLVGLSCVGPDPDRAAGAPPAEHARQLGLRAATSSTLGRRPGRRGRGVVSTGADDEGPQAQGAAGPHPTWGQGPPRASNRVEKPREGFEPPGNGSAVRRINLSATSARRGRTGSGLKFSPVTAAGSSFEGTGPRGLRQVLRARRPPRPRRTGTGRVRHDLRGRPHGRSGSGSLPAPGDGGQAHRSDRTESAPQAEAERAEGDP